MKRYNIILLLFIFTVISLFSGDEEGNFPGKLPESFTQDELNWDWNPFITLPPEKPVRAIAEFEPLEAVLIAYPFTYGSGLPIPFIAELSRQIKVITIISPLQNTKDIIAAYKKAEADLNHCTFLKAPVDTFWIRDYGPWFVADGKNKLGIINFPYFPERENDDKIPASIGNLLGIKVYGMNLTGTGGNYMTDGMGTAVSTDRVVRENAPLSQKQIDGLVQSYLGIARYWKVVDPLSLSIDHIDCWGKFLAVDKVLISSVPENHPDYKALEKAVDYFKTRNSSFGTPFEIFRVSTPGNEPYVNSFICNNQVFVPLSGSSLDAQALDAYRRALPGYEVKGVLNDKWLSSDALHCRIIGIPDRQMVYIRHIPLKGKRVIKSSYDIEAEIISYGGDSFTSDAVSLFYSVNNGEFRKIAMTNTSGSNYKAQIPYKTGIKRIAYYIQAVSSKGKKSFHPFIGSLDPYIFEPVSFGF